MSPGRLEGQELFYHHFLLRAKNQVKGTDKEETYQGKKEKCHDYSSDNIPQLHSHITLTPPSPSLFKKVQELVAAYNQSLDAGLETTE